jgi:uncharacterized protein YccT (UPF0319 family)
MMKKTGLAIACGLLMSSMAMADSALTFQSEIVPEVVNSKAIHNGFFTAVDRIKIPEGQNQIGVTVGQLVFEDAKRRKFDSDLMLVSFDAKDGESYQLSYKKMRTMDEANRFNQNPQFTLTNQAGESLDYTVRVVSNNGFKQFQDYESEVVAFNQNQKQAKATVKANDVVSASANIQPVSIESSSTAVVASDIKTQFSSMTREQQQTFMQWAMLNLKSQ